MSKLLRKVYSSLCFAIGFAGLALALRLFAQVSDLFDFHVVVNLPLTSESREVQACRLAHSVSNFFSLGFPKASISDLSHSLQHLAQAVTGSLLDKRWLPLLLEVEERL